MAVPASSAVVRPSRPPRPAGPTAPGEPPARGGGLRLSPPVRASRPPAGPLAGCRVLVTGASSGIGAATVRLLAREGADLAVAGRDRRALAAVAGDTGAAAVPGDLLEPETARRTVAAAVAALGGLDLVVSNAGIGWAGRFEDMPPGEIDRLLDVNLRAAAHLVHGALPHLRRPGGRVVLVGSIAGSLGVPGEAWYSATKAGLRGFADALRAELEPVGVGVTLVTPGVVDTAFFDRRNRGYDRAHPRPVTAERLAAELVAGVVDGRDEVVVPGWLNLPARLHGGLPGLYRALARRLTSTPPALGSV